jgi:hypothetical protein
MKEIKIGLKFSEETGIHFFGIQEINAELNQGKKVISIQEGDVIMNKQEMGEEDVTLILTGFSMKIIIE